MSDSFPYNGVVIVDVIRNAVVTQAWADSPCRSSPMVRIAVETIIWSSAARNMPSIRPVRIVMICRCDSSPLLRVVVVLSAVADISRSLPSNPAAYGPSPRASPS